MERNEQDILESIRKGNLNAFKQLFENYYSMLCGIANGYLNDKRLAEEVTDDVFFKIWENREVLIIHTSMKAYLVKAVRYRSLNCLEQIALERKIWNDFPDEVYREDFFYIDPDTPLSDFLTKELEEAITREIASLPDECRKIFLLSRFENLKYEEIALRQNISVNTVKTQMKIALQKLRQKLAYYLVIPFYILIAFRFFG